MEIEIGAYLQKSSSKTISLLVYSSLGCALHVKWAQLRMQQILLVWVVFLIEAHIFSLDCRKTNWQRHIALIFQPFARFPFLQNILNGSMKHEQDKPESSVFMSLLEPYKDLIRKYANWYTIMFYNRSVLVYKMYYNSEGISTFCRHFCFTATKWSRLELAIL